MRCIYATLIIAVGLLAVSLGGCLPEDLTEGNGELGTNEPSTNEPGNNDTLESNEEDDGAEEPGGEITPDDSEPAPDPDEVIVTNGDDSPGDDGDDNTDVGGDGDGDSGDGDDDAEGGEELGLEIVVIEPDDFDDRTDLTSISQHATLWTTGDDNVPIPTFYVTASYDGFEYAPTGENVFGHANVYFFNTDRRLRVDFTEPTRYVSIWFAGGTFSEEEIARLEVYDSADNLLEEYVTSPRNRGETEMMSITRSTADIAWVLAYSADGEGNFIRLDRLRFTLENP